MPSAEGTNARARSQSSWSTTIEPASESTSSSVAASLAAVATACMREFWVTRSCSWSSVSRARVMSWNVPDTSVSRPSAS